MQAIYACMYSESSPNESYEHILKEVEPEVLELEQSKGMEGDMKLMKTLFFETLRSALRYDEYLRERSDNWDLERIAWVDRILMQMALCEVLNFEDIPVKVTLNEYIEIAKQYSTPDSGKFINGILDPLFQDFIQKGMLRKNQRGQQSETIKRK